MASQSRVPGLGPKRVAGLAAALALAASLVPLAGVAAAATHHEVAAAAAGDWIAGTARSFTVTAHNEDHSVDAGYRGTVRFHSDDPLAVLPADYTFTAADAGVHTFSATLKTAGSQRIDTWDVPHGAISGAMTVTVIPAVASKLGFVQEPGDGVVNVPMPQQPVVVIQDEFGNRVSSATAEVTLSRVAGPAATRECKPATSLTTVAGVAAFVSCQLNASGGGFVLRASAVGLASADSAPFDLAAVAGPTARLNSGRTIVTYLERTTLDLQLSSGGVHRVRLFRMEAGSTAWVATGTGWVDTDAAGRYTFTVKPKYSTNYQVRTEADDALGPLLSDTIRVAVRHLVVIRPAPRALMPILRAGTLTHTASVAPIRAGVVVSVTFAISRRLRGHWRWVEDVKVKADASGVATLERRWAAGEWEVRALAHGTGYNIIGASERVRFTVR